MQIADLTWVSDADGWGLGSAPCSTPPCTSVVHTLNGGQSWAGLPAPVAYLPTLQSLSTGCSATFACVSGIRFASASVGYVFGQSSLWMTTDGGHSWTERSKDTTDALEVDGSTVVRVVNPAFESPPGIPFSVEEAPVGSTSWHTVLSATVPGDSVSLAVQGSDLSLLVGQNPAGGANDEHGTLYRSTDGGTHWASGPDPCGVGPGGVEADARDIGAAPGGTLVAGCTVRNSSSPGFVVVSSNAGASFGGQHPAGTSPELTRVAAATPQRLVVLTADNQSEHLSVSWDGGVTWTTTYTVNSTSQGPQFLGFEDANTGRAIVTDRTIVTTSDGGQHWVAYTFPS
ncbi:MAG: YCF48-related protein [Acidimicrobiales bacterium]